MTRHDVPRRRHWVAYAATLAWAVVAAATVAVSPAAARGGDPAPKLGVTPNSVTSSGVLRADTGWLETINHYRTTSGLNPVTAEPAWVAGQMAHISYMANSPAEYDVGPYANLHHQNPASPWYTAAGDAAGRSSNIGYDSGTGERDNIDSWATAPFHAIGMLRPDLKRVAYASASGYTMLNVISGIDYNADAYDGPVLFPGNGATTHKSQFLGELPDPREGCGTNWADFGGFPVIALLENSPHAATTGTHRRPDGTTVAAGEQLCVQTAATFASTDTVYGPTGTAILNQSNAVLLIPRQQLAAGVHTFTIKQPGEKDVTWSYTVVTNPTVPTGLNAVYNSHNVATLTWSPPANSGGVPITGYTIEHWEGDDPVETELPANARSFTVTIDHADCCLATTSVSARNELGRSAEAVFDYPPAPAPPPLSPHPGAEGPPPGSTAPTLGGPMSGPVLVVDTGVTGDTAAVLANITMADPTVAGYITADRCANIVAGEQTRSNGNHNVGGAIANLSVVNIDASSQFCLYRSADPNLIVDIQGTFNANGSLRYAPSQPRRITDTRPTGMPAPGSITRVSTETPAGTRAVLVNLTMTGGQNAGYITADQCENLSAGEQSKSSGNHGADGAIANLAVVAVDDAGEFCIYNQTGVHLIVDVQGSFAAGGELAYTAQTPSRVADTRTSERPAAGTITRISTGTPPGTQAALINITMVNPAAPGYVTADRCDLLDDGEQSKSSGNHDAHGVIANLNVVAVDAAGEFCLYNQTDVDVIVDIQGSFSATGTLAFSPIQPTRVLDTR